MTKSEAIALAQEWQHIAERCTREIVRMRKMIAEAPVAETVCDELIDPGRAYAYIDGNNVAYVIGRRVRLLVEDGE